MKLLQHTLTIVLLGITVACNHDDPAPGKPKQDEKLSSTSMDIDRNGGTIQLSGAILEIGPGALSEPTTITVTRKSTAIDAINDGVVYDFSPDGITFNEPVKLTLPVPEDIVLQDNEQHYVVKLHEHRNLDDPSQREQALQLFESNYDAATRTVSAMISGFSEYGTSHTASTGPFHHDSFTKAEWDPCGRKLTVAWDYSLPRVRVERLHRQGGPNQKLIHDWAYNFPGTSEWTHGGLYPPATNELAYTYVFRVYSFRDTANGPLIIHLVDEVTIPAPEVLPPADVSGFTATRFSDTSITLDWSYNPLPEDHYDHFELWRSPQWPNVSGWRNVGPQGLRNDNEDVDSTTQYRYWMRAVNTQSCERPIPSWGVTASTFGGTGLPGALLDLTANAVNAQTVALIWRLAERAAGYIIARAETGGPFITLVQLSGPASSFTDTTAYQNTEFTYRVTPVNSEGEGQAATVTVTTPSAPLASVAQCTDLVLRVAPQEQFARVGNDAPFNLEVERLNGRIEAIEVSVLTDSSSNIISDLFLGEFAVGLSTTFGNSVLLTNGQSQAIETADFIVRLPSYAFDDPDEPSLPATLNFKMRARYSPAAADACEMDLTLQVDP